MPAKRPTDLTPEALGLIEFSSIGRGARTVDDVVKKAAVDIRSASPVSGGKFLLIFTGGVGPVEESYREGLEVGAALVINRVFLPQVHPGVMAAMEGRLEIDATEVDALAILESTSLATTVAAADAAAKAAEVSVIEVKLGIGIGGKGFFTLTGSHADVEAAVAAARAVGERDGTLLDTEIIPRPHEEVIDQWIARKT